jgi:hypothetical protein
MINKKIIIVLTFALLAFIIFAALGPARFVPRTGLGWQTDHFAGYFVFTAMFCCVWRRAYAVGASVSSFAVLLEIFQGLTPDRTPDVMATFYSTSGVFAATLLADLLVRSRRDLLSGLIARAHY